MKKSIGYMLERLEAYAGSMLDSEMHLKFISELRKLLGILQNIRQITNAVALLSQDEPLKSLAERIYLGSFPFRRELSDHILTAMVESRIEVL